MKVVFVFMFIGGEVGLSFVVRDILVAFKS